MVLEAWPIRPFIPKFRLFDVTIENSKVLDLAIKLVRISISLSLFLFTNLHLFE